MNMTQRTKSAAMFDQAQQLLVGGVNSPVRAFKSVGCAPMVVERATGPHIFDADGNRYIDYVCAWGPMILGHGHPSVVRAVQEQAAQGMCYGMSNPLELELAQWVTRAMPSIEMLRFVCSGTEATMSAVRAARGFTGRDYIVKFEGCYHGHADSFLSEAGSGLATLGIAASPGVPACLAELTLNLPYNDLAAVEKLFAQRGAQIAAVIVEPVAANMGVVPPAEGFLQGLRAITTQHGALLIFDEVISGFRLARGGAQQLHSIRPDLTTLGKIIGGGLPVAAYGGRRDVMQRIAPLGPIYQAGTLSGNPLGMRAGLATVQQLDTPGFYDALAGKAAKLAKGLRAAIADAKVPAMVNVAGSLLTLFFCEGPVRNYADAKRADTKRFAAFFQAMLERGVLLPPSQFEAWFISAAHSDAELDATIAACRQSLQP